MGKCSRLFTAGREWDGKVGNHLVDGIGREDTILWRYGTGREPIFGGTVRYGNHFSAVREMIGERVGNRSGIGREYGRETQSGNAVGNGWEHGREHRLETTAEKSEL